MDGAHSGLPDLLLPTCGPCTVLRRRGGPLEVAGLGDTPVVYGLHELVPLGAVGEVAEVVVTHRVAPDYRDRRLGVSRRTGTHVQTQGADQLIHDPGRYRQGMQTVLLTAALTVLALTGEGLVVMLAHAHVFGHKPRLRHLVAFPWVLGCMFWGMPLPRWLA